MKKILTGLLLVAASNIAFANPGCGAGSMVFKGQTGLAPHVLAATTNGTFGNQTFAMTTGTLGCNVNSSISVAAATFVDQNLDQIAADMSRGEGEHLNALMLLLKVEDADRAHFKAVMQNHFSAIISSEKVTSSEALAQLEKAMKSDETLSKYVG
jgi:hypothetical protein